MEAPTTYLYARKFEAMAGLVEGWIYVVPAPGDGRGYAIVGKLDTGPTFSNGHTYTMLVDAISAGPKDLAVDHDLTLCPEEKTGCESEGWTP